MNEQQMNPASMQTQRARRKLLFVAPLPPPFGGVAQVSDELLRSRLSDEFDVRVVDSTRAHGLRAKTFDLGARSFLFAVRLWLRLVRELILFRPRIVYVASSYDASYLRNVVLMCTAKLARARVVCHFHGRRDGKLFADPGGLLLPILRLTSGSFDRIIFLSEGLRGSLEFVFGKAKGEVVTNFVDAGGYRTSTNVGARAARLIFVGRLSDDKGVYELLDAVARLHKERARGGECDGDPSLSLDLLGAGETEAEERAVSRRANELGINGIVRFHGVVTGAAKLDLLARSSVFVLPSKLEILPLTLLEAFACGLPIVATPVGAIPEVVRDGENGLLIPPGDARALADALRRLIDDADLRSAMGDANRRLAEIKYNKDTAVDKIIEIFNRL